MKSSRMRAAARQPEAFGETRPEQAPLTFRAAAIPPPASSTRAQGSSVSARTRIPIAPCALRLWMPACADMTTLAVASRVCVGNVLHNLAVTAVALPVAACRRRFGSAVPGPASFLSAPRRRSERHRCARIPYSVLVDPLFICEKVVREHHRTTSPKNLVEALRRVPGEILARGSFPQFKNPTHAPSFRAGGCDAVAAEMLIVSL
jgi:hypothetical protein